MYRKLIALGATAVIAAAAFAPTAASAKGGKWHWHGHGHGGLYVGLYPDYVDTSDCYIVNKVVYIHHHKRIRQIQVCD